jgi:hypothetical protein
MLIVDSAGCHLNPEIIRLLRKKSVVVAVIPTGCTMCLQSLDISIFSTFKNHYTDAAEEYLEQNGPRSKIKLSASQSRILCTRLTMTAWKRTIATVNFKQEFKHIGYIWTDNSPVSPRTLPGYTFDPSTINLPLSKIDEENDEENERRIETQAKLAENQSKRLSNQKNQQKTLAYFWKKQSNYVYVYKTFFIS